jgi:transglutaminase-like putative cysteine protease
MEFEIRHRTTYAYPSPAAEAYVEARLTPPQRSTQSILEHRLAITPATRTSRYPDHFGNTVDFFSLPFRHEELAIENHLIVRTVPPDPPADGLALPIQEVRQIFNSSLTDVFELLQPTPLVDLGGEAFQWARRWLPSATPLGEALDRLNAAIHETFQYASGSTDASTPLDTVWKQRRGVCQDFAHVALSILRTAGLPSRYVCGYIETDAARDASGSTARRLVGATATHAWVEVLVPGQSWLALDPTNRQRVDDRYVAVSFGRDARDASPVRGTFKGIGGQKLSVAIQVRRRTKSATHP